MAGWIKLHRSLRKHWLFSFDDPDKALAWIDMLMATNYKPGKVRRNGVLIDLERGDLGQSANGLAELWGWSRGKVIRFLDELETDGMIVQHKDKRRGKITICNYDDYQSETDSDGTTGDTTGNTTGDTTGGQQANNTKEVNKNNKVKTSSTRSRAKVDETPYGMIVDTYHRECKGMKQCLKLTAARKKRIKDFWSMLTKIDDGKALTAEQRLAKYLEYVFNDTTLPNERWADLHWLMQEDRFLEIKERKYDREESFD